jgi:hypothetical protein
MPKHQAPRSWAKTKVTELPARAMLCLATASLICCAAGRLLVGFGLVWPAPAPYSFPSALCGDRVGPAMGPCLLPHLSTPGEGGGMALV